MPTGRLIAASAISGASYPERVFRILSSMEGSTVAEARVMMMSISNVLARLTKADRIVDLGTFEEAYSRSNEFSALALMSALDARNTRDIIFVPPSDMPTVFQRELSSKAVRRFMDTDTQCLVYVFQGHDRVFIPPKARLGDKDVNEMLQRLRDYTDKAYQTCDLTTETVVRLVMALDVPQIQNNRVVRMATADFEKHCRSSVNSVWVRKVIENGKEVFRLVPLLQRLVDTVYQVVSSYTIAPGASKKDVLAHMLKAVCRVDTTQLGRVLDLLKPSMQNPDMVMKFDPYLGEDVWHKMNTTDRSKAALERGWLPVTAVNFLETPRNLRKQPALRKLAGSVDQPGFTSDVRVSQIEKIARVVDAMKLAQDPPAGVRRVTVGVDKGFTMPFLASYGFEGYDLVSKTAFGHEIRTCDVNNSTAMRTALAGAEAYLGEVARSETGAAAAGKALEKCSYNLNRTEFDNQLAAVIASSVKVFAIKTFLPPDAMVKEIPAPYLLAARHFECIFIKPGKLHNDEVYLVGTRRARPVGEYAAAHIDTLERMITDLSLASGRCITGNILIMVTLASGHRGPAFKWASRNVGTEQESRELVVAWPGFDFRPATPGEVFYYNHTHELCRANSMCRENIPSFGEGRDVHVVTPGVDDTRLLFTSAHQAITRVPAVPVGSGLGFLRARQVTIPGAEGEKKGKDDE